MQSKTPTPDPSVDAEHARAMFEQFQDDEYPITVGYGDRYPLIDEHSFDQPREKADVLEFWTNNDACGIRHVDGEAGLGYDLTTFCHGTNVPHTFADRQHGVENFIRVLDAVGLDLFRDYVRVYRDLGYDGDQDYPDYFKFVWINDEIMVATSNNPITGEPGAEDRHWSNKYGYASYMGVHGTEDAVEAFEDATNQHAGHIKDYHTGQVFY